MKNLNCFFCKEGKDEVDFVEEITLDSWELKEHLWFYCVREEQFPIDEGIFSVKFLLKQSSPSLVQPSIEEGITEIELKERYKNTNVERFVQELFLFYCEVNLFLLNEYMK